MRFVSGIIGALCLPCLAVEEQNLARSGTATASTTREKYATHYAIDGVVADKSRWLAAATDPSPWLELAFPQPVKIGAVDIYTGFENEPPMSEFTVSFEVNGQWQTPEEGRVVRNSDSARRIAIELEGVTRLKIDFPKLPIPKIREIAVYGSDEIPAKTGLTGERLHEAVLPRDIHYIALNQIGYKTSRSKHFTAPLSPDGTKFFIRSAKGGESLFNGVISKNIGDFSNFRPADSENEYVVEVSGEPLKPNVSDPFIVRANLWEEIYWQPAVDFLIDTRSVTGTHPSAYGGTPWRDGTYYDYVLPALVLLQKADPKRIEAMPRQIDWAADKARVLSPYFKFDDKNPSGDQAFKAAKRYFNELEPPAPDAPDVVKLMHWGAGFYLMNPVTLDPSKDPAGAKLHYQTVEQMAYVVWAWPSLKQWLPVSFYEKCRDFCFEHWDDSMGVDERWNPDLPNPPDTPLDESSAESSLHPYKGRHAPGNSIGASLMMHEVAKREGRVDAERFLANAVAQADWIVKNLDWNDPRATKGQRMSEHRTIPNLVWLLDKFPDRAPEGLKQKITDWARIAIRRSDNMWDFRKYDDASTWTIPRLNDVGNCAAFPAIATAASWAVDDPAMKTRLHELADSHVDYLFGRNPKLAATIAKPELSFPQIERGWPKLFPDDVCARLELCRGSISSSPGTEMFPFNPEGAYRHPEGWVTYGAAWAISLAYLQWDATR